MFFGTNTSMVKRSSATQLQPTIGFVKTKFAHKAAAGDTQITLTSLTIPPEMSANGFSNPTAGQIAAAQLLFYRRNLRLWSSTRNDMTDFYQYTISSSSTIAFIGFTAEEGEIFEGTIDYQATSGFQIAATISPPATGTLAAGTTDFNVGFSFQVNQNPTTQMGNVTVYRGGVIQLRNVNNATASQSANGDYQEVDLGTGFGQLIRFNRPDPDNATAVVVIPNGRLMELPTGSMMAVIENLNGQINSMATYVAALSGTALTTVLGSAATNTDLKAFGDRVIALESNRARIDLSNTWTAPQQFPGVTTGIAVTAGNVGEAGAVTATSVLPGSSGSYVTLCSKTFQPGNYVVQGTAYLSWGSGTGGTRMFLEVSSLPTAVDGSTPLVGATNPNANWTSGYDFGITTSMRFLNLTVATTYYLIGRADYSTVGSMNWQQAAMNFIRIS